MAWRGREAASRLAGGQQDTGLTPDTCTEILWFQFATLEVCRDSAETLLRSPEDSGTLREGACVAVGRGLALPPWDLLTGRRRLPGDTRKLLSPLTEHQDASPEPLMRREASGPFPDEQTDGTKTKGAPGGLSLCGVRLFVSGLWV